MDAEDRLRILEEFVYWEQNLFSKAFGIAGLWGDYLEFGVFEGGTLSTAYWCAFRHFQKFATGRWDMAHRDAAQKRRIVEDSFNAMRFIGFDSFAGIPPLTGPDAERAVFEQGTFASSKERCLARLQSENVPLDRVRLVEGYFADTCNAETARTLGLERLSVVHIDSDLYASAVTALDFATPYLRDGTVIIFDEWFQFSGSTKFGEQRAFREWRERNPEWNAAILDREAGNRVAFVMSRK